VHIARLLRGSPGITCLRTFHYELAGGNNRQARGKKAQGLKPDDSIEFIGTTEEAAEKGRDIGEISGKHTSGPKGRIDSAAFMPGINPRPTSRQHFSASCEAVPFYKTDLARFFIKLGVPCIESRQCPTGTGEFFCLRFR
jgi:hypothetical protein